MANEVAAVAPTDVEAPMIKPAEVKSVTGDNMEGQDAAAELTVMAKVSHHGAMAALARGAVGKTETREPLDSGTDATNTQPDARADEKPEHLYVAGAEGRNFYTILDVGLDATPEQISEAYKRGAFRYHPDSPFFDHAPDDVERFKDINEAFFVLSSASETEKYRSGAGRYNRTEHPDRPKTDESSGAGASQSPFTETSSSDTYAPRRGESWTAFRYRVYEETRIYQEDNPRREDFERFMKDVNQLLYEELAKAYKAQARLKYRERTGREDFDEFYSHKDGENRDDYRERIYRQLKQDLPGVENFDEVFSMLSDNMFPSPARLLVPDAKPKDEAGGVIAQVIKVLTDTGGEADLTRAEQQARMNEPGFKVSLEKDPQYKALLVQKIRAFQQRIEEDIREGRGYPQDIEGEIGSLKAAALAQFQAFYPEDAAWYDKNSPKLDREGSHQTREEVALRQKVAAVTQ